MENAFLGLLQWNKEATIWLSLFMHFLQEKFFNKDQMFQLYIIVYTSLMQEKEIIHQVSIDNWIPEACMLQSWH